MNCMHPNLDCSCKVAVLQDAGVYMLEVTVRCIDCGKPFQFLGLEPGIDTQGARVSLDGLEANIAMVPEGVKPNPFQRLAHGIRKFD